MTSQHFSLDAHCLGLDVGARRIGVALAHVHGGRATPLTTIAAQPPAQALAQLKKLIRTHTVVEIVIGLPLTLRGEHGPQAQEITRFGEQLAQVTDCPLHYFDERLTSAAAEQLMRDLAIKPARRKELIDQVAAALILQDFLDARERTSGMAAPAGDGEDQPDPA